jgi:hypothetical protein
MPAKNKFFYTIFLLITFKATFTSFFTDKKSKRFTKGIEVFLTIFA